MDVTRPSGSVSILPFHRPKLRLAQIRQTSPRRQGTVLQAPTNHCYAITFAAAIGVARFRRGDPGRLDGALLTVWPMLLDAQPAASQTNLPFGFSKFLRTVRSSGSR